MNAETDPTPENLPGVEQKINELAYPIEYFDAQVRFACRWSEVTGEPLTDALLQKTALYRRLVDKKPKSGEALDHRWQHITKSITVGSTSEEISQLIFNLYREQNHAQYQPPNYPDDGRHFGFFGYDYYPTNPMNDGKNTIKIHFLNLERGEKSSLHPDYMEQRKKDLKRMFEAIRDAHPEAEEVVGGSWLYSIPQYRDTFPPQYIEGMKRLVPPGFENIPNSIPNMSFGGNSLWGQFVNRHGGPREAAYQALLGNLQKAETTQDLIDAFPDTPMQPKANIKVFYNHFGISEK